VAKCVKKKGKIIRISDKKAAELINEGWEFCPKNEFKKQEAQKNEAKNRKKVSRKK
jgi:hypothetical protein